MDLTAEAFLGWLRQTMPGRVSSDRRTWGVEHEVFLVRGARLANDADLAALHAALLVAGWQGRDVDGRTVLSRHLDQACPQTPDRWHHLSVEHPPHLIEVATGWTTSLDELEGWLHALVDELARVAHACGLSLVHQPVWRGALPLQGDATRPELTSSRAELARRAGLGGDPWFTARMAATQVSIGGLRWWEDPTLLARLYAIEPALQEQIAAEAFGADGDRVRRERVNAYARVFCGLEALLFPAWLGRDDALVGWATALARQPPSYHVTSSPTTTPAAWWRARRDLQWIRPRVFGPLECRGDPALPDVDRIMMAVRRRAAAVEALHHTAPEDVMAVLGEARTAFVHSLDADVCAAFQAKGLIP